MDRPDLVDNDGAAMIVDAASLPVQRVPSRIMAFPDDVIALAVRWYVRYRLSYADVVEWFAERGLDVNRSTVYRWVQALSSVVWRSCPCSSTPSRRKMAG